MSNEHVTALNLIDIEFAKAQYDGVKTASKTYLDHLNNYPRGDEKTKPALQQQRVLWLEKRVDLLAQLLVEMVRSLGYSFDTVYVKRSIYAPEAHAEYEDETTMLRRGFLRVLVGDISLPMKITDFPQDEEMRKLQIEYFEGKRPLPVKIVEEG